MKTEFHDGTLTIFLEGRIDSNNANETEAQILEALKQNSTAKKLQFDADGLEYISSAGLRVLLKVRKTLNQPVTVLNASNELYDIFSVTGFTELLDVRRKLREVSVDGCEVIGEGYNGKVYRLTKDEMIKVFKYGIGLDVIEAEREASRKAFLFGIPCAIAFDTVKCGDSYGTVYEILNAGTLTERINANPERLPELAGVAGKLLKQIHAIDVPEGDMPRVSRLLHNKTDKLAGYFTPDEIAKLHGLYNTIPEQNHFVHSDYHPKNIMESNGELMLIDLGDAGRGNPYIDLIHSYDVLCIAGRDVLKPHDDDIGFCGITFGQMKDFWGFMIEAYCDGDKAKAESLQNKIAPYSRLMYCTQAMTHPVSTDESRKIYAEKLRHDILSRYDELINTKW